MKNSNYQKLLLEKGRSFTNGWMSLNLISTTTGLHSPLMLIESSQKRNQNLPLRA